MELRMDLIGLTILSTLTVLSLGARDTTQHVTVMVASCVGMHVMYSTSVMGQTENLAEGKPTDQSSTYPGEPGVPAGFSRLAVDGTRDHTYNHGSCSHTDSGRTHWWRVDLEQSVTVSRVVIYNRGDCCGERLRDFSVEVGVSEQSGQVDYEECYHHAGSAGSVVTVTCTTLVCGRYVRIIKQDDADQLALCEVEVFGTVLGPDTTCTTSTTDGTSTSTYPRVTMITNDETATSPSTMSTNRPSSLTTQEVTSTTTADLATDVSAGSASTTPTDGLTHLSSPKPDSSTADVTTAGSMTSLETSTTQETDSSTADMTTAGSMISREMSTSQETDSSKADVATAGSMISRETSTAQTTHASSTQTRNPSTTGNVRVALPTKRSRSCQCVLSVPSNTTERTVTAVVKNMNEVRQSLLVNKTQTGKTIRKKTSADDERTPSKIGGFAAVVFLASVCAFLFSFDFLALIGYCRTYLKRRKATSP